jgi:hypothetical protein
MVNRSDITESRKWGIYSTTNLLFKTYFKVRSSRSDTRHIAHAPLAQLNRPVKECAASSSRVGSGHTCLDALPSFASSNLQVLPGCDCLS